LNQEKSELGEQGRRFLPSKLNIKHEGNTMIVERIYQREYEDDFVMKEDLTLDGKECKNEVWNDNMKTSVANWSEDGTILTITSTIIFQSDGNEFEIKTTEILSQTEKTSLSIDYTSESSRGERKGLLIFDKN
jgi:hypothetical protein